MKIKSVCCGVVLGALCSTQAQEYLSPCDIDWAGPNKDQMFVTAATGNTLLKMNSTYDKIESKIAFPCPLSGTAVSPDGKTMFVTGGGYFGKVFCVYVASGKITKTYDVGHTPVAPVLSPDGKTLYVSNRFNNNVDFLNLTTGKSTRL